MRTRSTHRPDHSLTSHSHYKEESPLSPPAIDVPTPLSLDLSTVPLCVHAATKLVPLYRSLSVCAAATGPAVLFSLCVCCYNRSRCTVLSLCVLLQQVPLYCSLSVCAATTGPAVLFSLCVCCYNRSRCTVLSLCVQLQQVPLYRDKLVSLVKQMNSINKRVAKLKVQ